MLQNRSIVENILVSGYLREEKYNIKLHIPEVITNVISFYAKEYIVQIIGSRPIKCDNFHDIIPTATFNTTQHLEKIGCEQIKHIMCKQKDKIINIESGSEHHLILTLKGNVYGIGSNKSGQLGLHKNIGHVNTPTLIPFNNKIKAIACGNLHSLFINESGKLLVCGHNYAGQLGISSTEIYDDSNDESELSDSDSDSESDFEFTHPPIVFKPIYNKYFDELDIRFKDISCGSYYSLCITKSGECFTFGHNFFGTLGNGQTSEWGTGTHIPHKLAIEKKFKKSSCGQNHNILLSNNNELVVFGNNSHNQCSITKQKQFESPYFLAKEKEFGVDENCFIEDIICENAQTTIVIDFYKRQFIHT